jgi:TPR repeat protein
VQLRIGVLTMMLMACRGSAPGAGAGAASGTAAASAAAASAPAERPSATIARLRRSARPEDRVHAVQVAEAACARDDGDACVALADALEAAEYVDKDVPRALALRLRWCDRGLVKACTEAGRQYLRGEGVPEDAARGQQLLARACDGKDTLACSMLASEAGKRELYRRAFDLDLEQCRAGDPTGCFDAHSIAYNHHVDTDVPAELWTKLAARFEPACTGGDADACNRLSWMAAQGLGRAQDPVAEKRYRQRECDLGDANACAVIAYSLDDDPAAATRLHRKACDLGDGGSCEMLAEHTADPAQALAWQQRACDLGRSSGCGTAAQILEEGRGVPADPARARALHDRLCRRGWPGDCVDLAAAAAAAGDVASARQHYELACRQGDAAHGCAGLAASLHIACAGGDQPSCGALDQLLAGLTPSRRAVAAFACCRDRVGDAPIGYFLAFQSALAAKDLAGVKAFVDPRHGLHVRVGSHDEDGSTEDKFTLRARSLRLDKLDGVAQLDVNNLRCPETFDAAGAADCSAFEGGFDGEYRLTRTGQHVYLVEISEESH